jgi:hypothetical protein
MSNVAIKNKIYKSLEEMDANKLQSVYLICNELAMQEKYTEIGQKKEVVNKKIAEGIAQLDNNEGTDFRDLLNEINIQYDSK